MDKFINNSIYPEVEMMKLKSQGARYISLTISKIRSKALEVGLVSLLIAFIDLALIFVFKDGPTYVTAILGVILLLAVSAYPLIMSVFTSFWFEELLVKFFAKFVAIKSSGGIGRVSPTLIKGKGLVGWLARKRYKNAKLSKDSEEFYEILAPEWGGDLDGLLFSSREV